MKFNKEKSRVLYLGRSNPSTRTWWEHPDIKWVCRKGPGGHQVEHGPGIVGCIRHNIISR